MQTTSVSRPLPGFRRLLAYDTFTRADGAIGSSETTGPDGQSTPSLGWTGNTWTVSSNKAVNTPTLGSELAVNGGFDADTDWNKGLGWTIGSGIASHTAQASDSLLTNTNGAAGVAESWYQVVYDANISAGTLTPYVAGNPILGRSTSGTGITLTARGVNVNKFNFIPTPTL